MIKKTINKLLNNPAILIRLRRVVENNFKKQKEVIKKYFFYNPEDSILDLGCGSGEFSVFFQKENYVGIDIDATNIEFARKQFAKNFIVADAKKLPFDNSTFSKILVSGVFHHMSTDDCLSVFSEMKRVLKPEGSVLVMEDTQSKYLLTSLIQKIDQGNFIRSHEDWSNLFERNWSVKNKFTFKNGLCFYSTFLLDK